MTTKKSYIPDWAAGRIQCNLAARHLDRLNAVVAHLRKDNHRASVTSVIEEAIDLIHAKYLK